ncbi:MAG: methyltransferase domain-containing protein [Gemmatimonadaceae bacterium]|nr:methyltransferase domain-containing protein [Gemmatimonadaceae bacterium]
MKLLAEQVERLEQFLERIKSQTYPEPPSPVHGPIIEKMVPDTLKLLNLPAGARVLDVGCGQGVAMGMFRDAGLEVIGVTLNEEDRDVCARNGLDVRLMDQSFLDFEPESFDMLWVRHCLEHSIFPYFTLEGFARVLKKGGWLYVEVPAPDTSCKHQTNPNHYSVLGKSMWESLFGRAGFVSHAVASHTPQTGMGPDAYWTFLMRKKSA